MPDREKVIKGLESFVSIGSTKWSPHRIDESWKELQHLLTDAIALLKEQEHQIETLTRYAKADMIDVDALFRKPVKWE